MSDEAVAAPAAAPVSAEPAAAPTGAPVAPTNAAPAGDVQAPKGDAKPTATQEVKYDLKPPEGMKISEQGLAHVLEVAKARGWDNETAQGYLEDVAAQARASVEQSLKAFNEQRASWRDSVQKDPELGGQNMQRTLQRCGALMKQIDPKGEFRDLMNKTGLGDHPTMVRAIEKMARFMVPDDVVTTGNKPAGQGYDPLTLYPSMRKTG